MPEAQQEGPYSLHLGSFRSANAAEIQAAELRAKGLNARVITVSLPQKGVWYRVVFGAYATYAAARDAVARYPQFADLRAVNTTPRDTPDPAGMTDTTGVTDTHEQTTATTGSTPPAGGTVAAPAPGTVSLVTEPALAPSASDAAFTPSVIRASTLHSR